MKIGYARVSTEEQNTEGQVEALKAAKVEMIYTEKASGGRWERPELHRMLDHLREGDVVVVWKLDRLSRSLKDLINTLDELGHLGINFISYDNNLDTTTPTGKLVFQIIGAVAEFEKDIIRERVVAGLENAKQKGKQLGRPKIHDGILEKAKELRSQGMSFRKIEKQLGLGEGTIRKKIKMDI